MPTNESVLDELERRFLPRDKLPGNGEPGSGLANSPRRSYMDTAIVLSPADYETLRSLIADARELATLKARVEALREHIERSRGEYRWCIEASLSIMEGRDDA